MVEEVTIPDLPFGDAYRDIVVYEAKKAFAPLIADGTVATLRSPQARDGSYLAGEPNSSSYAKALNARQAMLVDWTSWASQFDAFLTSTNPKVAPPLNTTFSAYFGDEDHEPITTIGAVLGFPTVTFCSGLGKRNLPTGAQLIGLPHTDTKLCRLAESLTRLLPRIYQPDLSRGRQD